MRTHFFAAGTRTGSPLIISLLQISASAETTNLHDFKRDFSLVLFAVKTEKTAENAHSAPKQPRFVCALCNSRPPSMLRFVLFGTITDNINVALQKTFFAHFTRHVRAFRG
ncbi:MAG: hypothetical protein WEB58_12310, partial [Planctomycetaceae bacterium]